MFEKTGFSNHFYCSSFASRDPKCATYPILQAFYCTSFASSSLFLRSSFASRQGQKHRNRWNYGRIKLRICLILSGIHRRSRGGLCARMVQGGCKHGARMVRPWYEEGAEMVCLVLKYVSGKSKQKSGRCKVLEA